jgi:hypothetical protein
MDIANYGQKAKEKHGSENPISTFTPENNKKVNAYRI